MSSIEDVFQNKKVGVLFAIKKQTEETEIKPNISDINRALLSSHGYISRLVRDLRDKGFLSIKRKKREKVVSLTDKGNKLATKLLEAKEIVNGGK